MNARIAALIVTPALVLGSADANIARADDASQLRATDVGPVIGQQGNDALHRIRIELASTLHRRLALPALPALVDTGRNGLASGSADPAVRISFNP
ncbi:MAG: hypothetical protein WC809_02680 [Sinimarinibacterium sp.]